MKSSIITRYEMLMVSMAPPPTPKRNGHTQRLQAEITRKSIARLKQVIKALPSLEL